MTAQVIRFPRRFRELPPSHSPAYWRGIEDWLTTDLSTRRGWARTDARRFAQSIIADAIGVYPLTAADGMACNMGEGEAG